MEAAPSAAAADDEADSAAPAAVAAAAADRLLARTLQGKFLLTGLDGFRSNRAPNSNAPEQQTGGTWRPLVLPRGELTLQRSEGSSSTTITSSTSSSSSSQARSVSPTRNHGPLLLLHCVDEARLLVYTTSMLGSNSSRRLRPIFAFSLPERTLPGSIHVGRHTILCAQEHAGGLRVLVLARHLAEESATPHPPASAVDIDDTKSISSAASVPASSGAAARFAALRSLLPQAILQSIPLPKGTVMLLAPLTNEPPLGDFLFATRSTLHSLRPWRDPTAICRKLLQGAVQHGGESQGLDDDAASRVGLAWILARTFTLDFDALNAHANAHALINANEPPSSSSSQRRRTGFAPAALHSAVAVATSPSARSTALLLSYLGRLTSASAAGTSSATERPPLLPSNAMAALLSQLPPIDQPQRHNNGSSTTTSYHHHLTDEISMDDLHLDDAAASVAAEDEEAATAAAERRSAARVDLVRLCCHLHARLVNNDDDEPREASQQAALERSLDTVASAALSSAPIAAARILASTGSWRPLLLLLPPIMTIKTSLLHPTLPLQRCAHASCGSGPRPRRARSPSRHRARQHHRCGCGYSQRLNPTVRPRLQKRDRRSERTCSCSSRSPCFRRRHSLRKAVQQTAARAARRRRLLADLSRSSFSTGCASAGRMARCFKRCATRCVERRSRSAGCSSSGRRSPRKLRSARSSSSMRSESSRVTPPPAEKLILIQYVSFIRHVSMCYYSLT